MDGHHRLVHYFSQGRDRQVHVVRRGDEHHEIRAKSTIGVNDFGAMLAAGLAGVGIARIAPFMAAPHLAAGTLREVLPDWNAGATPLFVVYPPNRHVSAKLRVFIDWAVELFARTLQAPARPRGVPAGASQPSAVSGTPRQPEPVL
jgi:DNA-binding transcriptional LysR family regulator